ncbi:TetR/AcrR family transcriptional regulator [Niallia sp. NCCP-28]|uniref:TetR/AcrR family transcriptional regulator n=1 Tax=Niallia sp. NCCP-28 TaxID=2934712 RepID=UPI0020832448|nr:TetR/AcrR family transcriptional regulator [Niallia sp. NCCP-28]GKU83734.1 TetR family transcriptional regulator [Niallia sp. NCCP-28]
MSSQESILDLILKEEKNITNKQKKILIAAIEAFSDKGYAATSTNEIAKKAGVAEGTIFRHYKTKKDLLTAILTPLVHTLIAPFIVKDFFSKVLDLSYNTFEEFIRAIVYNRLEFLKKNQALFKILIQEIPFHEDLRELFKEQIAKKIFKRMEELVESFKAKSEIIDIPTYSSVRLTVTSIFGYFIARYILLPEAKWNDEEEIETTIQFILYGLTPRK